MVPQRPEIKERLDAGSHPKSIVDLDEIVEKWVSSKISIDDSFTYLEGDAAGVHISHSFAEPSGQSDYDYCQNGKSRLVI